MSLYEANAHAMIGRLFETLEHLRLACHQASNSSSTDCERYANALERVALSIEHLEDAFPDDDDDDDDDDEDDEDEDEDEDEDDDED